MLPVNHHGVIDARNLQLIGVTADTLCEKNTVQISRGRVCCKRFSMTQHRKWCRGCGHPICRDCNMTITLLKDGVLLGPRLPVIRARFCLRCLLHASEQRVKGDVQRERMITSGGQTPELWWYGIATSVDGLLDVQRESVGSGAETDASVSSTDSKVEEETDLAKAIAKADELTLIAAFVAEKTTQLRKIHRQQYVAYHNA